MDDWSVHLRGVSYDIKMKIKRYRLVASVCLAESHWREIHVGGSLKHSACKMCLLKQMKEAALYS